MAFGNIEDGETGIAQEGWRDGVELLAVLKRAGGVVGDAQPRWRWHSQPPGD